MARVARIDAHLLRRHGAASRELQQGRPIEAPQHDAEAPFHGHLVEHLRRWGAGGEGGAGHSRLPPAVTPQKTRLEQLQHLTGRPGMDVGVSAFADLLPQGSLHHPLPPPREQIPAAGKDKPLPRWDVPVLLNNRP